MADSGCVLRGPLRGHLRMTTPETDLARRGLSGRGFAPVMRELFARARGDLLLRVTVRARTHRTPVEIGAGLDRERVVLDVADDMGAALEHDVAAADRAFDPSVHHDALGLNAARDRGFGRNDERGAIKIALDLAVDLDKALGRDRPYNLQSFGNDGPSTPEHGLPPTRMTLSTRGETAWLPEEFHAIALFVANLLAPETGRNRGKIVVSFHARS